MVLFFKWNFSAWLLCFFLCCVQRLPAQVEYGLAALYPQDAGIERDSAVIFTENFEEDSIAQMISRWEDYKYPERMFFVNEFPPASGGRQALFMNGFADLYRRILPGYDTVYARFYAKLDTSCLQVHHWVWLGGHHPSTAWPWPRAGTQPAGDERWSTGIEPHGNVSRWDFYTYWKDMRIDRDGNYWGNTFASTLNLPVVKGEWLCVEFMVKMNSPAAALNGEQAFWINGEKKFHLGEGFPAGQWDFWNSQERGTWLTGPGSPFAGLQWRTVPELNINYFWLEHYVDSDPGCECWFDDIVLARKYIGPLAGPAPVQGRPASRSAGVEASVFPNPFSLNKVNVSYRLPNPCRVQLTIHDAAGRCVYSLAEKDKPAGFHTVAWPAAAERGQPAPAGIYFLRLQAGGQIVIRKMIRLL